MTATLVMPTNRVFLAIASWTTSRYDRARGNLDRHAVHTLAAYIAGAA